MSVPKKRANDPTEVTVRLIQRCDPSAPGAVPVAGTFYRPLPLTGLNGERGFQVGHYEQWLGVEGPWTLDLPNTAGPDGKLHVKRFLQITDPLWQLGDEFIEVRRDNGMTHLYTGALIDRPSTTLGKIQVSGFDGMWLLKKVRETEAGFWCHAPRDVLEHYTRLWGIFDVASAFPEPGATVITTASGTPASTGSFTYTWAVTNTGLPVCRLVPQAAATSSVGITTAPPSIGYTATDPYMPWRVEASVYISAPLPTGASVLLGSVDQLLGLEITGNPSTTSGVSARLRIGATPVQYIDVPVPGGALIPGQVDLAVEGRERWIYCYVHGQLVGIMAMPVTHGAILGLDYYANGGTANVDVQSLTYERAVPWLMRGGDKGDYRLPGAPPPGGLQAEYFDAAPITNTVGISLYDRAFDPTQPAYAARLDASISHATGAWFPAGPASDLMVRRRGSIYLDLANFDYRFKVTTSNDAVRLWVGKTRMGEPLVDLWPAVGSGAIGGGPATSSYLRSIFGQVSGWYPLSVEMFAAGGTGSALTVTLERSDAPGTFATILPTILSPYGIYHNQVRRDSHYDTYKTIADAFGYQYRFDSYSLESLLFPGQLIPRVRVGTDYDVRVDQDDTTDLTLASTGQDMAVRLVGDAQGIADPNGAQQLSATVINYANVKGHMFAATEVDSFSDITDPQLLQQRMSTELALRSGTWDQLTSRPQGHPMLAQAWPPDPTLPILPLKFAWQAGDGVTRNYGRLGLIDQTPTPLASVAWNFSPHAIIAPQATYRIYPRGAYWTFRKFRAQDTAHNRNYQGQLAERTGTTGGITGTIAASPAAAALDQFSRISTRRAVKAWLDVTRKLTSTVQWTIEINGMSTGILVNFPGLYDVTSYLNVQAVATAQLMIARLTTVASPTDTVEYGLLARITI